MHKSESAFSDRSRITRLHPVEASTRTSIDSSTQPGDEPDHNLNNLFLIKKYTSYLYFHLCIHMFSDRLESLLISQLVMNPVRKHTSMVEKTVSSDFTLNAMRPLLKSRYAM